MFLRFVADFGLNLLEGGAVIAFVAGPQTWGGGVGQAGLRAGARLAALHDQAGHHHHQHADPHLNIKIFMEMINHLVTYHRGINRS